MNRKWTARGVPQLVFELSWTVVLTTHDAFIKVQVAGGGGLAILVKRAFAATPVLAGEQKLGAPFKS